MEEKKTYSVEEVLEITINNLKGISVPVDYTETIAIPIRNCIGNLEICIQASRMMQEAQEKAKKETEAEEDGPDAEAE